MKKGAIYIFLSTILFSSMEIVLKTVSGDFNPIQLTLSRFLTILYIFIGVTGLGYAFYFKAMEETSANTTSLIFFFKPILSPILALIFLKETISLNMALGVIFILIGSLTSILPTIIKTHKQNQIAQTTT